MELNHMDAILAQNKMITKQLADLTKQMERNQAVAIHIQPPAQEELNTEEGSDWEQANYIGNASRQAHDPYSNTYNPGWKNHPNFGWGNQENQSQDHRPHNSNHYNNFTYQQPHQRSYQNLYKTSHKPSYQPQNNHSQPPNSTQPSPSEDRLSRIEAMLENLCKESEDMKNFKEEVRSNLQNQDAAI
ncbi:hypothetical protein AHAS_Ahas13G0326500 [Arachis hypogaea]